ncbi:MAG: family oxidoreductase [Acidobacteriaceae bacterium]|nr:family oxidoreductase [Acidobacteriaceae bacterium]
MDAKQVVLITGSSTGFGRRFADTLARKGHTVFATMRDPRGGNGKNASAIRALAKKDSLPIYVRELPGGIMIQTVLAINGQDCRMVTCSPVSAQNWLQESH